MRNAKINEKSLFVCNIEDEVAIVDSQGYKTGEKKIIYSQPIYFKASVSGARGNANVEAFGTDVSYDKTIVMSIKKLEELGITENSVLFIDNKPSYEGDDPLYDYSVSRIATSVNEAVIAVSKVRK